MEVINKNSIKMTTKLIQITVCFLIMLFVSCSKSNDKRVVNDPKNGERIYECSVNENNEEFSRISQTSSDGYKLISIQHNSPVQTELYQLYSPNGNLCLVASGAQEACALTGYRLDYSSDGKVSKVCFLDTLDDDDYRNLSDSTGNVEIFKEWLSSSLPSNQCQSFDIIRNEKNDVVKVGTIEVPDGFKAKYFLREWGPFWVSDLDGGCISFFVELESQDTNGSYVNYLYSDNKLIAEMAYWNGTFIKARTYNKHGAMVNQYSRDIDIFDQTFYDYNETPKWYVDD